MIPYLSNLEVSKPKCDPEIERRYKSADKYVIVNDDPDLYPIKIYLPEPPAPELIDGYGLPREQQFFRRQIMPNRLKSLQFKFATIEEIWNYLDDNKEFYEAEIEWISLQWSRRLYGYWFYNNGKPTYLDGWHYFYLNFWELDIGLPEYRDRDRKFFLFARYCYTTTDAFYPYRVKNNDRYFYFSKIEQAEKYCISNFLSIDKIEEGAYVIDTGRRTVFGFTYPKHRREGATFKWECISYCIITTMENAKGGIQSMTGPSAKSIFLDHLVKPWKRVPFFFKPAYTGTTDPKTEINFDATTSKQGIKGSVANIEFGLQSTLDYAETAGRSFYDGKKLYTLHNDEAGKTVEELVHERWPVQRKCLSQGNGLIIHGLTAFTSTVGEMEKMGGKSFFILCRGSHYQNRNSIGQTETGLLNFFLPAYEGLEGFIDIFGNSIIEDPSEKDLWRIPAPVRDSNGQLIGAKRYLIETRENLLLRDDLESMELYEEEVRLHPIYFSECFITSGSGAGLNLKKIVKRYKELQFDTTATRRVTYQWKNGIRDTEVEMIDDPISGRWTISLDLPPEQRNRKYYKNLIIDNEWKSVWFPMNPGKFVASADAYAFMKTRESRMSKGGGSVFWRFDKLLDGNRPIDQWESYRNVCTYSHRQKDPDEYAEDMLMMCVYWGSGMFPEINIPLIWNYFVKRGYAGYLLYEIMPNGQMKTTPGFFAKGPYQQRIFLKHQQYIENHCQRERHIEVLDEAKSIKGIEELKDYDLFTSVGGGYIADESCYFEDNQSNRNKSPNLGLYIRPKRI